MVGVKGGRKEATELIHQAMFVVGEYEQANLIEKTPKEGANSSNVWQPPQAGWYKWNSDAAFFGDKKTGLGAVMRDTVGDVMVAKFCMAYGEQNVEIGESLAARHGMKIALEAGLQDIVLEVDSVKYPG